MRRYVLIAALLMAVVAPAASQLTVTLGKANLFAGKTGIGVDGITGSPNVLVKYFFNSRLAGQLIAGVEINAPGGDTPAGMVKVTGLVLRGGFGLVYHLTSDQVSPYVGAEVVYHRARPGGYFTTEPDAVNSLLASAVFGGEYFVIERFSLGLKIGVGLDTELKKNSDKRVATSTVVTGRVYFN